MPEEFLYTTKLWFAVHETSVIADDKTGRRRLNDVFRIATIHKRTAAGPWTWRWARSSIANQVLQRTRRRDGPARYPGFVAAPPLSYAFGGASPARQDGGVPCEWFCSW